MIHERRTYELSISKEEVDAIRKSFPRGSVSESIRAAAFAGIAALETQRIEKKDV